MSEVINKTMDRVDLLTQEGKDLSNKLNNLIRELNSQNLYTASWYGSLPSFGLKRLFRKLLKEYSFRIDYGEEIGRVNKSDDYEPIEGAYDDNRLPWFLYWEILWVLKNGPKVNGEMKLLDAGGASSLFSCYLSSLGYELHSVDLSKSLVENGNLIAKKMNWKSKSHCNNLASLPFEDSSFDHAYSICVFEHLDFNTRFKALEEIARCLKPGGTLSLTFDYKNPSCHFYGQNILGKGTNYDRENHILNEEDIFKSFLSNGKYEVIGNKEFYDNKKVYLKSPDKETSPYTFGALFLRKI